MTDRSDPRKKPSALQVAGSIAFVAYIAVVSCFEIQDGDDEKVAARADSAAAPARVDTLLSDGHTTITSDGWVRSDGLKYKQENGVLYIDSGNLGGRPLPAPITRPSRPAPPPPPPAPVEADTETVVPPDFIPASEALWVEVARWSGTGDRETARFRVGSDEWRLVLTLGEAPNPRLRTVHVHARDLQGRNVGQLARDGAAVDTGYVHAEPGIFHLRVRSYGTPWTVVAQEKRVPAERLPKAQR